MAVPLDYLFPVPSSPPSRLAPRRSPVSPASTEALQTVLRDNHTRWHVFFNKHRFHNHAAHRAIALWALGGDADLIRKAYDKDCSYEQRLSKSPEPITEDNFNEHLGDDRYYDGYIQFFSEYIRDHGIASALEEYVFSVRANLGTAPNIPIGWQPQMLNRFVSGVLHPVIHTGCGAEFGLPGLIADGLAETAVHYSVPGFLGPLLLFTEDSIPNILPEPHPEEDPHALTILARVLRDTKLEPIPPKDSHHSIYPRTVKKYANGIAAHVNRWNIDPAQFDYGWEKKLEEIVWTVVVLYGVAGWTYGRNKPAGFIADFFVMHLVTSSIFLPSICAPISPVSRARLLKAYLAATCTWAVARGRPHLDIRGFVEDMQQLADENENLWPNWIELAKVHPDEHFTKTIRSLAGWASVFGSRKGRCPLGKMAKPVKLGLVAREGSAGEEPPKLSDGTPVAMSEEDYLPSTELPGAEYLDGGLFLRVATLTVRRMGCNIGDGKVVEWKSRQREDEREFWDFDGYHHVVE